MQSYVPKMSLIPIWVTSRDSGQKWVKLKERTKIVAGPSEFLISIILVAT